MEEVQQQRILAQYQQIRQEITAIAQKITEFEGELHEHNLVITTLSKVEPTRRCYRQVGDVLAERTVAEVLPAVTLNRDGILELSQKLAVDLQEKQKEEQEFAKKYKIEMKSPEDIMEERKRQQAKETTRQSEGNTGVLV
jgi:prefoldin subunit 2